MVLLECLKESPALAEELMEAFEGELNPVAPKAQRKVIIIYMFSCNFISQDFFHLLRKTHSIKSYHCY